MGMQYLQVCVCARAMCCCHVRVCLFIRLRVLCLILCVCVCFPLNPIAIQYQSFMNAQYEIQLKFVSVTDMILTFFFLLRVH